MTVAPVKFGISMQELTQNTSKSKHHRILKLEVRFSKPPSLAWIWSYDGSLAGSLLISKISILS